MARRGAGGGAKGEPVAAARHAALRALQRVGQGARSELALATEAPADARDRALCWHLVCGTLQHRGELDFLIERLAKRPITRIEPLILDLLRMALFELRCGRAPAHAVVHQAVALARAGGQPWAAGFVNAVLRAHGRADISLPELASSNHPAWLLERWMARYGRDAALAWARRNNEPAPLCVALHRDPDGARRALEGQGLELVPATAAGEPIAGLWWIHGPTGPVEDLPGAGRDFWVQDPAAAAVVDLLDAEPGARVLDACAAPGGKTLRLASQGAEVLAVDRSPARLDTLRAALHQAGLGAEVALHDWTVGPLPGGEAPALFDGVLVDAPCTGLGTTRRHPEIRWRREEADLTRAAALQLRILLATARHVAPGGALVYAVCSPEPEEGEGVVADFLRERTGFALERTWSSAPPRGDEDAFWGARLRRAERLEAGDKRLEKT
ncbi:MAG: transcription antitermination factor NusB [Pseudomonadota bacterium]